MPVKIEQQNLDVAPSCTS